MVTDQEILEFVQDFPTFEELEEMYTEMYNRAYTEETGTKKMKAISYGQITKGKKAGQRALTPQTRRVLWKLKKKAIRGRTFLKMSPAKRRQVKMAFKKAQYGATVNKRQRSKARTDRQTQGQNIKPGFVKKYTGRKDTKKKRKLFRGGQGRLAADIIKIYLDESNGDTEVSAFLCKYGLPEEGQKDSNMYLFGVELSSRLYANAETENTFVDWEIVAENDDALLLYFQEDNKEGVADKKTLENIKKMLEDIGDADLVIAQGEEIEENQIASFSAFSFFPKKEAFVALSTEYSEAEEVAFIESMLETAIDAQLDVTVTDTVENILQKLEGADIASAVVKINTALKLTSNEELRTNLRKAKASLLQP